MTLRYDYGMIVEYSEYTERVNVMTDVLQGGKPATFWELNVANCLFSDAVILHDNRL